jgi:hypothetical protein
MIAGIKAAWLAVQVFAAGVPRWVWYALAGALAVALVAHWHNGRVAQLIEDTRRVQAEADARTYTEAAQAAADAQQERIDKLTAKQTVINERTTDALQAKSDDIGRRYDDLRLRWAAHRAAESAAGDNQPAALPRTATGFDAAACAAEGWVSFDVAATAAEAADRAIAKDDQWRAWYLAQREAWPK